MLVTSTAEPWSYQFMLVPSRYGEVSTRQLPVVGKMKIRRKLTMLACIIVFFLFLIVCSAVMVSLVYQQKSESEKKLDDEEQMEYLHNLKSSTKNEKSPVDKKLS